MKTYFLFIVLFFSLALFLQAHTAEDTAIIHMSESGFDPQVTKINQGEKIIFENTGNAPHWPASDFHPTHSNYPGSSVYLCATEENKKTFDTCGAVLPDNIWEYVFAEAGEWTFHDHINPEFSGTIIVEAVINGKSFTTLVYEKFKGFFSDLYIFIFENPKKIIKSDEALKKHIESYGVEKTLEKLNSFDALKKDQGNCHDKAHLVGELAYELLGDNAFEHCSMVCDGGCYHGTIGAYVNDAGSSAFVEKLKNFCLNSILFDQCYHGLGHGLLVWAEYDVPKALDVCNRLSEEERNQKECWHGIFMENVVGTHYPREIEKYSKYINDEPDFPCTALPVKYKRTCQEFVSVRLMVLHEGEYDKLAEGCMKYLPENFWKSCFAHLGYDVIKDNSDIDFAKSVCSLAPNYEAEDACLFAAVKYLVEGKPTRESKSLCKNLENINGISKATLKIMCGLDSRPRSGTAN